jgi:histidyl-tRNA synthetase
VQPKAVKGMNDVLPAAAAAWQYLERVVREVVESYGYAEIRLPLLEQTELFKRSIGEVTDIVEKEMYTFDDRGGESLTLRPEATAGMVRAGITNGLLHNQRHKLWTTGPMFRRERPQRGRYRQFHQFDVEALGFEGPDVDAEMIIMSARIWKRLGIDRLRLEINSLGTPDARAQYRSSLVRYFSGVKSRLDQDSIRRLDQNPLRILDSKNPDMQELIGGAPVMLEYLDAASAAHFESLKRLLDAAGIAYVVNPRLVRGLDYYSRTVFEWVTDALGAQGAICSGGRYDGLVEKLGGRPTPAIGWAMGIERFVDLYGACGGQLPDASPDVYIVAVGEGALEQAFAVAEEVHDALPALKVDMNLGDGSFKAQLKRADRSNASLALVLGEEEIATGRIGVKPLRSDAEQGSVLRDALVAELKTRLKPAAPGAD